MRTTRIYHPGQFQSHETVTLSSEASHHIITVLRMTEGASLTLFNGQQQECQATIVLAHKKQAKVTLTDIQVVNRESPLHIHLAQGIAKGDKMEWIVQKATELGVTEITPIFTLHGSVKQEKNRFEKKWQQWNAIATYAAEQSGRTQLPILHEACHFDEFIEAKRQGSLYILDPSASLKLKESVPSSMTNATLVIGPEGGFHPDELSSAKKNQYHPISLGPRILRTETAGLTALSILQALLGDL